MRAAASAEIDEPARTAIRHTHGNREFSFDRSGRSFATTVGGLRSGRLLLDEELPKDVQVATQYAQGNVSFKQQFPDGRLGTAYSLIDSMICLYPWVKEQVEECRSF